MSENKSKVIHYSKIPSQEFGPTAPGSSIRWMIDDDHDDAPTASLRMIEVQPGGSSPRHTHPYEHENFVVEGKGRVLIEDQWHDLNPGDVAYVPPGILHQYVNAGDTVFKFLCLIPVKRLQGQAQQPKDQAPPTPNLPTC